MGNSVSAPGESKECSKIVTGDLSIVIKGLENMHPFDPVVSLLVNPLWMCQQFNWESISFFLSFFLWPRCAACGIEPKPGPLAVRAQSPNYWTIREFLEEYFFKY